MTSKQRKTTLVIFSDELVAENNYMFFRFTSNYGPTIYNYDSKQIAFIFDVTKLPDELKTVWGKTAHGSYMYPLGYLYHIAETYLERYKNDR